MCKNFLLNLMHYYINAEDQKELCELKETINKITNLSDAEMESFVNYIHFNWTEYTRCILTKSYTYVELTTLIYSSWVNYRKNL